MATRPRGLLAIIADAADEAAGLVDVMGGNGSRLRDGAKRARRARQHIGAMDDRVTEAKAAARKLRTDLEEIPLPRRGSGVTVKQTKESA